MKAARPIAMLVAALLAAAPALAIGPDEKLADAAQEARANALFGELRCMVCQNQSIHDSDAPLAKDLRVLVREKIAAGDSEAAIKDYLVARYGEFVLLKPPLGGHTLMLWALPGLVLLGGGMFLLAAGRRRGATGTAPLTADEQTRLDALREG